MNIIDRQQPAIVKTESQIRAEHLLNFPAQIFRILKTQYQGTIVTAFETEETSEILNGLGQEGVQVFDFIEKLNAFLEDIKPGCTDEICEKAKPITKNQDGTVALT